MLYHRSNSCAGVCRLGSRAGRCTREGKRKQKIEDRKRSGKRRAERGEKEEKREAKIGTGAMNGIRERRAKRKDERWRWELGMESREKDGTGERRVEIERKKKERKERKKKESRRENDDCLVWTPVIDKTVRREVVAVVSVVCLVLVVMVCGWW